MKMLSEIFTREELNNMSSEEIAKRISLELGDTQKEADKEIERPKRINSKMLDFLLDLAFSFIAGAIIVACIFIIITIYMLTISIFL